MPHKIGEHGPFLRLTLRGIPVIVRTIIRDPSARREHLRPG